MGSVMCSYNRLNGAARVREPAPARRHPAPRLGLQGLRARRLRRPPRRSAPASRAGLDFEPWPFVDSDGGENLTPAACSAALAAGRTDPGRRSTARCGDCCARCSRYGFFDRAAYVDDDSRVDRAGHHGRGARIAEGGIDAAARTTAPCRSTPTRLRSLAVIGADGDALQERRRLLRRRPVLVRQRRAQGITARAGPRRAGALRPRRPTSAARRAGRARRRRRRGGGGRRRGRGRGQAVPGASTAGRRRTRSTATR